MGHESYDIAFRLCNTLRLYQKKFIDNDNVTLYPSSWYTDFFEITIRDKNNSEKVRAIDKGVLNEIISRHITDGWVISFQSYGNEKGNVTGTPVKIQFTFAGEN